MGKLALVTTLVEEFDSQEALEHYVKEHAPFEFDDKVDLLQSKKIIIDTEDDSTVTVEILEEFKDTDAPATEKVEDAHQENNADEKKEA